MVKRRKHEAGVDPLGVGGFVGSLTTLIEKLHELAEKGEELRYSGEIGKPGSKVRGLYGFSVKVGLGEEGVKIEPFGNIRKDEQTGETLVSEIREPAVDVFEEEDHILVVAEMPGIGEGDLKLELKDDILTISAERGDKQYRKEVLLPASFASDKMKHSCRNGVLEVKFSKK